MLEIEKKFLVKLPDSWGQLVELFDNILDIKRITQTYLKPEAGKQSARVRKTVEGLADQTKTIYDYNRKEPTGDTGVNKEIEHSISEKEYNNYLKNMHPDKCTLEKTRFVFEWHDQVFELDIFKNHLKGLAILEIELDSKKEKIELPSFLKIIKNISKEDKFNNFELASKKHLK